MTPCIGVSVAIVLPRKPRQTANGARVHMMRSVRYGEEWTKTDKMTLDGKRIQETEMLFHSPRSSLESGWPPFKSSNSSSVNHPLMWSKSGVPLTEAQETLP